MVTKVVPWIMGITLTSLVIYWISRVIRYGGSDSWTLTSGKIERYDKPTYMGDTRKGSCFTQARYSYTVDGGEYSGTWLTPVLRNLEALNEFLEKELPVGKEVSVRYKPGKPGRSVLADGPELEPEPMVMKTDFNV
ncbi:MAG TPA: DUF3592 domain-containing protein [Candidatus Sulfotelmatobacter sp.]|jgi:hypothetical protein|nr:DUF3592 domain-containing protein [Candidatus Sulfotelmatobacter sp.]